MRFIKINIERNSRVTIGIKAFKATYKQQKSWKTVQVEKIEGIACLHKISVLALNYHLNNEL